MPTRKSQKRTTRKAGSRRKGKPGVTGYYFKTAPEFERSRENCNEFGRASKAGKLLRMALGPRVKDLCDSKCHNRLRKTMHDIIKSDSLHRRGARVFNAGNADLLLNFQFNAFCDFATILDTSLYSTSLDPHSGIADITIASFIPDRDLRFPEAATHFRFIATAIAIDFDKQHARQKPGKDTSDSGPLPIDKLPTAVINLTHQLPPDTGHTWLLILGIQFEIIVNGMSYEMKNKKMNGMGVIEIKSLSF
ncbi:hypothetical protein LZZ85_00265 [Terrimonas sp. NA20]|uniref:Uncharacterized protein n=1 Tax=Terrimonas ginsenosidimutans TaxID=2908004 RepID=A0ABS9KK28_9BACT|nr:hypothetical protein [Terrimonas ginsenosidimutans]MCG2612683.1 hypothetical protein [Terrimonas ginsenosidimutans]